MQAAGTPRLLVPCPMLLLLNRDHPSPHASSHHHQPANPPLCALLPSAVCSPVIKGVKWWVAACRGQGLPAPQCAMPAHCSQAAGRAAGAALYGRPPKHLPCHGASPRKAPVPLARASPHRCYPQPYFHPPPPRSAPKWVHVGHYAVSGEQPVAIHQVTQVSSASRGAQNTCQKRHYNFGQQRQSDVNARALGIVAVIDVLAGEEVTEGLG